MSTSDVEKTLVDLKNMSILTGELAELHIKNLKAFPYIFFDHITSCELSWDINLQREANKKTSWVKYNLTIKESNDLMQNRVERMTWSVKNLLWNDTEVYVYVNGTKYESKTEEKQGKFVA